MAEVKIGEVSWERMIRAVEKVRERLLCASAALEKASVPYAVVVGNAVAAWVSRVDEAAVRNTQDVIILLRRADLDAAASALTAAGFVQRHVAGIGNRPWVGEGSCVAREYLTNHVHDKEVANSRRVGGADVAGGACLC